MTELPIIKGFRPIWMKASYRQAVVMSLDEYEALRLIDYEAQIHEQAAETMKISRPTFTRIYETARQNLATALVEGRSLLIEGGNVAIQSSYWYCEHCHTRFVSEPSATGNPRHCPECNSERLIYLNECFMGGCRRCRRCK